MKLSIFVYTIILALIPLLYMGVGIDVHAQNTLDAGLGKGALSVDCEFTDCNVEDIFGVVNKIINVLIWVAVLGLVVNITISGFKLAANQFFPGEVDTEVAKVKKSMLLSILGLFIALAAFLIVKFVIEDVFKYRHGNVFDYREQVEYELDCDNAQTAAELNDCGFQ